jgi:hypothetical protein
MLLNQLACEHGEKFPERMLLNIRLTHQIMSEITGLPREAMTRSLDKLQVDSLVSTQKRKNCLEILFKKNFPLRILPFDSRRRISLRLQHCSFLK